MQRLLSGSQSSGPKSSLHKNNMTFNQFLETNLNILLHFCFFVCFDVGCRLSVFIFETEFFHIKLRSLNNSKIQSTNTKNTNFFLTITFVLQNFLPSSLGHELNKRSNEIVCTTKDEIFLSIEFVFVLLNCF